MWVSPFRYLRIVGYLLLPEAFRSLSRLSSALSAKASTLRSYSLDLPSCIALQSVGLSHFFEFRSRGCYLTITSSDVFLDILQSLYAVFKVQICYDTCPVPRSVFAFD